MDNPGTLQVTGDKLGLFGSSTGGNLALSIMACLPDKVSACVVSGAAFASLPGHTYYNGQAGDRRLLMMMRI